MATRLSSRPVPGAVTGAPVHIPFVLFCTQGERWCGWQRTANSQREFLLLAADRRVHEAACLGGLVAATSLREADGT